MQVFRVVTEKDGETTREPGEFKTKIIQVNRHYAANTIAEVWEKIKEDIWEGETLIAVIREQESITILGL